MLDNYKKYNLIFVSVFIYIFYNIISHNVIFDCNITSLTYNMSNIIINKIKTLHLYSKSNSKYIYIISQNESIKQSMVNIDSENYILLLIKGVFVTERVIIYDCKILLFSGQCNFKSWYKSSIQKNENIIPINNGFILTSWHGDGVFHGTVEGLTRIVPYIDFLLNRPNIYIIIPFPRYKQNTASKLLQLIGFEDSRILYGKYFVRKLFIPTPFYCVESSTPLILEFNKILRLKIKDHSCKYSHEKYILILQRSKNRIINNFEYLKSELIYNFNYTIVTYYDKNKNLDEIYCWFAYAKIIIAYHGSGLTNIYLSQKSSVVIELSPINPIYAFAKLGSQIGLKYYIYKLPIIKLYTKYINFNISVFISTLKFHKIFI